MYTLTSVGHGQVSRSAMLNLKVLVGKLGSVDGLTTSAGTVGLVYGIYGIVYCVC